MFTKRLVVLTVVLALVGVSCTSDSPTSPGVQGTADADAALLAQYQAELGRTGQAARLAEASYDSLANPAQILGLGLRLPLGLERLFPLCAPQPYDADVQIIGPAGGELEVGPHRLVIPPGALARRTVITAETPVSPVISVELSPHGLTFERPVQLELSYRRCLLPVTLLYRMAYTDEDYRILEFPRSVDRKLLGSVVGSLSHFSKYAVAY